MNARQRVSWFKQVGEKSAGGVNGRLRSRGDTTVSAPLSCGNWAGAAFTGGITAGLQQCAGGSGNRWLCSEVHTTAEVGRRHVAREAPANSWLPSCLALSDGSERVSEAGSRRPSREISGGLQVSIQRQRKRGSEDLSMECASSFGIGSRWRAGRQKGSWLRGDGHTRVGTLEAARHEVHVATTLGSCERVNNLAQLLTTSNKKAGRSPPSGGGESDDDHG